MFPALKIPRPFYTILFVVVTLSILFSGPFIDLFNGFIRIQSHPSILVSDFIAVGGFSASLLNAWLLASLALWILRSVRANYSGVAIAGMLTLFGFSFFGKNLVNVLPVWFGFWLFTKITKSSLRQYVGTFLFSSGIAPVVSYLAFGLNLPWFVGVPLGILSGILLGILTPLIVAVVGKFHQGYNLYNTGFGLGFLAMLSSSLLSIFSVTPSIPLNLSTEGHIPSLLIIGIFFVVGIVIPLRIDRQLLRKWGRLLQSPGNLPSDYQKEYGSLLTLFNMSSLALFSLVLVFVLNITINGPILAGIFTLIGFGAYGKHLKNITPIIMGVLLASLLPAYSLDSLTIMLAIFFGTALAPIAGKFGPFYGVLAGFLVVIISPFALRFQGGFDLYNFGFTAGFVAGIVVVIAQQFPLRIRSNLSQKIKH